MPDPHITASGERFARDMRRIREAHGVSMEDIYRDTMISVHVIESFEQDGLFEHPTFNRVYLRSFVRSYAEAIEVAPPRALEELERALKGDYTNELAVEYLDDEPEVPASPAASEEAPAETDDTSAPEQPEAPLPHTPSPRSAPEQRPRTPASPGPEDASEPASASPAPDAYGGLSDGSRWGVWIGIGIVLLIILLWMLIGGQLGSTSTTAPSPESTPSAETTQEEATQLEPLAAESLQTEAEPPEGDPPEAPPVPVALGDTMYFTVIAEESVSPIRIRRDDDLRRPYYIEAGQAALFPAQQRIILEEALESIRLLVNGFEYPVDTRVSNGQVVLTRDTVEAFLEGGPAEPPAPVVPADTHQVWSTNGFAGN